MSSEDPSRFRSYPSWPGYSWWLLGSGLGILLDAISGRSAIAGQIPVGCDPSALNTAITTAVGGDVLQLTADCTYSFNTANADDLATNGHGSAALIINGKSITIEGDLLQGATIERAVGAATKFRLFFVSDTGSLTLKNLTLQNGYAQGGDGGASTGQGGGGGGALGAGGAVYSRGALTIDGVLMVNNTAQGGAGGTAGGSYTADGPGGSGGGMGASGPADSIGPGGGVSGGTSGSAAAGVGGGGGGGAAAAAAGDGQYTSFGGGGGGGGSGSTSGGRGGHAGFGGGGGGGGASSGNTGSGGAGGAFAGDGGPAGGQGGGGAGLGGAVFHEQGSLTVENSTFSNNRAIGGSGFQAGSGHGAGLFSKTGTATVRYCTFSDHTATDYASIYADGATLSLSGSVLANAVGGVNEIYAEVDGAPPVPGNAGTLTSNASGNVAIISWTAASDDVGPASRLEYLPVYSLSNDIATVSAAETNGTAIGGWATDIASQSVDMGGTGTFYYNVLVRDAVGNKAAYTTQSIILGNTTLYITTNQTVTDLTSYTAIDVSGGATGTMAGGLLGGSSITSVTNAGAITVTFNGATNPADNTANLANIVNNLTTPAQYTGAVTGDTNFTGDFGDLGSITVSSGAQLSTSIDIWDGRAISGTGGKVALTGLGSSPVNLSVITVTGTRTVDFPSSATLAPTTNLGNFAVTVQSGATLTANTAQISASTTSRSMTGGGNVSLTNLGNTATNFASIAVTGTRTVDVPATTTLNSSTNLGNFAVTVQSGATLTANTTQITGRTVTGGGNVSLTVPTSGTQTVNLSGVTTSGTHEINIAASATGRFSNTSNLGDFSILMGNNATLVSLIPGATENRTITMLGTAAHLALADDANAHTLTGLSDVDTLIGLGGADTLISGGGNDLFYIGYNLYDASLSNVAQIMDFTSNSDKLVFSTGTAAGFTNSQLHGNGTLFQMGNIATATLNTNTGFFLDTGANLADLSRATIAAQINSGTVDTSLNGDIIFAGFDNGTDTVLVRVDSNSDGVPGSVSVDDISYFVTVKGVETSNMANHSVFSTAFIYQAP
jgi:fibronectin-binding autotransporter adhesin